jgi:hypothetical protein
LPVFVYPVTSVFLLPMKRVLQLLFGSVLASVIIFSCKKESFTSSSDVKLENSVDTLHFDTVFTTTGSTSQFVKLINNNNQGIHVSSVSIAGGASSPFKINVDGLAGPAVNNIDIAANDSAYIYVTVTINPNAANLAFVVRDSIEVNYNGNKQFIQLDAFGQNAHFFRKRTISTNEVWNNDLPYVILGDITVAPNTTLTINKGCKVYMHADAPFYVNGTLKVNGEKYDSTKVTFTGDRLDDPYKGFPASWPALVFTDQSADNVLNYTTVKNAYQGIIAVGLTTGTKLTLNQCIIDNAYQEGIWALNTSINATNLLISNCGLNINVLGGGNYNFTHCTIASYSNAYVQHKKPVMILADYYKQNGVTTVLPLSANFTNCIFWGEDNGFVEKEVIIDRKTISGNISFNGVLWREPTPPDNVVITGSKLNQDPLFDSIDNSRRYYSFRTTKKNSPVVNTGLATFINIDLDGKPRPVLAPDLGAYEKQ